MSTARYNYAAATMNGKIYVAGGSEENSVIALNSVECHDPVGDIWTAKHPMNYRLSNFSLVVSQGKLYAMGCLKYIEQYDPDQDKWTVVWSILKNEYWNLLEVVDESFHFLFFFF